MKRISLTQKKFALVDDEDFERVNQYNWHAQWSSVTKSFYARRIDYSNNKAVIYLARFIMNFPKGKIVDHKNKDTLDNQKYNLRVCSDRENSANSKSRKGKSKYKGITWHKNSKKWQARIRVEDIFGQVSRISYGEFAALNFPGEGETACM